MYSDAELKQLSITALQARLNDAAQICLRPPPKLKLSQWADTYRMLSPEASAEAGRWVTARAEYQREMLDACSDPEIEQVVFCTSAQIGKTEAVLNLLLYYIHQEPSPILLVQPTKEMAASFSKDRLAPALRDTKVVSELVSDVKSKDSGNTIFAKQFPGGVLNLAGSNAPASLASRPVRVALMDEVDRFPPSAGTEGSPYALTVKRTSNFFNRKIIAVSTPTDELTSVIWALYQESDQRKYEIRCVHCDEHFVPAWSHVKWSKSQDGTHDPDTALLHCPHCGAGHNDTERHTAVRRGKWRKDNPTSRIAGFHLSALISPWAELSKLVSEWLACQKDMQRLKTFVNTVLGEPWKDRSDNIDDIDLIARVEDYEPSSLPAGVVVLTAGVDTQDDRLEVSVYGHGPENETWHVEHVVIHGNPANPAVWHELETVLKTAYQREDGYRLPIGAAAIDSGGHFTQEVYAFARKHSQRRWFAIKGRAGALPIWPTRASYTKNDGKVYVIGVDSAKEAIYGWLKNDKPGAGYVHFSSRCDAEFFSQISAEKKKLTYRNGYTYYSWHKDPNRRNEALDCFVYALAAKEAINVSLKAHAAKQQQRVQQAATPQTSPTTTSTELVATTDPIAVPAPAVDAVRQSVTPKQAPAVVPEKKIPAWKKNIMNKRHGGWGIR